MSEELAKVFNVEPVTCVDVVHIDGASTTVVPDGDETVDHQYARLKNYEILQRSSEALDIAMRICRESENPRAIEVLSGLMKTVSDISKTLVVLNKDKADAKTARSGKGQVTPQTQIGTQNVVFAGNSADLNKLISGKI